MSSNINMTNQEYSDYVDTKAKKSPIAKNITLAFIVGGLICIIGQIITDICMNCGIDKKSSTTITTICTRTSRNGAPRAAISTT